MKKNGCLKFLSVLTALVMLVPLFSGFSLSAFAQDDETGIVLHNDGEWDHSVLVFGGTASFVGSEEIFSGKANEGDVLEVALTPQSGRTFSVWKTASGQTIPDATFRMMVGDDLILFPVFEDTASSPFGEWETLSHGNCVEGDLLRRVNALGDVEYKLEYPNGGPFHNFDKTVYVNEQMHKHVCSVCGLEEEGGHMWSDSVVIEEATHEKEGVVRRVCDACGAAVDDVIPKTAEHVFLYNDWTVITPSVNGQYGVRERKCRFCDYTERYWYLDVDYKSLFRNHYIHYLDTYGGKECHNEEYYHYVNEEGRDVYVLALQYVYAYSSGNDGGTTWIWTYVDDGNDATLDPVYLSRSYGETMGSYVNAHYGYVYDFKGYLDAIRYPDLVTGNMTGLGVFGNTMGARSSALLSWSDDWAEEYNNMMIPADQDPDSFLTTTGEFHKWEIESDHLDYSYTKTSVYDAENNLIDTLSPFADCVTYRRWVSGEENKVYDYLTVDRSSGVCLSKIVFTTAYTTRDYFDAYREIKSAGDYAALEDPYKTAYVDAGQIESRIRAFCRSNGRNAFGTFTLSIPEKPAAVRLLTPAGSAEIVVSAGSQTLSPSYNNGKIFYVPQSEANSSQYQMTFTWDPEKAPGQVFDRWEKWDYTDAEWKTVSTALSVTLNTYSDPLTECTFLRPVCHKNETTYHVRMISGTFRLENEDFTEADVPEGAHIYLSPAEVDGKEFDHYEDSEENVVTYDVTVTKDETYTAVYRTPSYSLNVVTYDGNGTVWQVGREDEADSYLDLEVEAGEEFSVSTAAVPGSEFTEFLGWYTHFWGKSGEVYELYSKDLTVSGALTSWPEFELIAVWSDGTVAIETGEKTEPVCLTGCFAVPEDGGEGPEGSYFRTGFSSLLCTSYTRLRLLDDPTDDLLVKTFIVSYEIDDEKILFYQDYDPEGETSVFVEEVDRYRTPVTVTATGEIVLKVQPDPVTVSPALSGKGYTEETIVSALVDAAVNETGMTSDAVRQNSVTYEATLLISQNGGKDFAEASAEVLPSGAFNAVFPYPDGTSPVENAFHIYHMFDEDDGYYEAGDVESLSFKETKKGLVVEMTHFSPVMIVWRDSDLAREIITGRTVTFGAAFEARYLIPVSAIADVQLVEVDVERGGEVFPVYPDEMTEMDFGGVIYKTFKMPGVAPKDIGASCTLTAVYEKDGDRCMDVFENDSVYAALRQATTDPALSDAMHAAAAATLFYCQAAAEYFGVDASYADGVPALLDHSAEYADQSQVTHNDYPLTIRMTSLVLKDRMAMKLYVLHDNFSGELQNLSLRLNDVVCYEAEAKENGRYWTFTVPLDVLDLDRVFDFAVYNGEGRCTSVYEDSVTSWAAFVLSDPAHYASMQSLARAILNYSYYVSQYLNG